MSVLISTLIQQTAFAETVPTPATTSKATAPAAAPAGATAKPLSAYLNTAPAAQTTPQKAPTTATPATKASPVPATTPQKAATTPAPVVAPAGSVTPVNTAKPGSTPTPVPAVVASAANAGAVPPNASTTTPAQPLLGPDGQPVPPPAPVITPEERHKQELLANAERVDQANRDLLADKQKMELQLEQLETQVNVLKNDRSNEGIRNGALAVIAGFLLGWFFASSRKSSW